MIVQVIVGVILTAFLIGSLLLFYIIDRDR